MQHKLDGFQQRMLPLRNWRQRLYKSLNVDIRIFSFNLNERCWFKVEKTYGKYKGTSQTKANVSQLAWNKGIDLLAIGTSAGHVFVYDAVAPYKNVMQTKGHQGMISCSLRRYKKCTVVPQLQGKICHFLLRQLNY